MAHFILLICLSFLLETVLASMMTVSLSNTGPAVLGSSISFTATVSNYDGSTQLKYVFWDDAEPQHRDAFIQTSNVTKWNVQYGKDDYEAGEYTVKVNVKKRIIFDLYVDVGTAVNTFNLTSALSGKMLLSQNNTERENSFVAVNKTVTHRIILSENDLEFLKKNTSSVITYWFVDCMYVDNSADFSFNYTYGDVMGNHHIDALVVANHDPLPPLVTTTTTTTTAPTTPTTTTTPKSPNSTIPTTTTEKSKPINENVTILKSTNETDLVHKLAKRAISNKTKFKGNHTVTLPKNFICKNSNVPIGPHETYGHFQATIGVREPISTPLNITGLNWLQHGDLMNLQVKFSGSPPFDYCAEYKLGQYNITGNETCPNMARTETNHFPLLHYFSDTDLHTVVVIVKNDLGKVVSRATVNIYKAKVHAQLSVIVVPVVFCLVAVTLVIFGVAYYQQSSRYTVEVADFDFGQQSNFDYKTFTERLRDSFKNAFNFGRQDDTDPLTPNTRYDSMT